MRAESGLIDLESGHGWPQCLETWTYHHGLAQVKSGGEVGDGSFRLRVEVQRGMRQD